MKENNMITEAFKYAQEKHKGQIRKYSGEPYIIHLQAVYQLVRQVTDDKNTWAAAILHDVIEDTDATYEEVKEKFGEKISDIVQECTKDENKNFKITMKEALLVKFADGLHNLGNNNDDWFIEKILYRWQPQPTKAEHMKNPNL